MSKEEPLVFRCSAERPYSEEALLDFIGDRQGVVDVRVFHPMRDVPGTHGGKRCPYCGAFKPKQESTDERRSDR